MEIRYSFPEAWIKKHFGLEQKHALSGALYPILAGRKITSSITKITIHKSYLVVSLHDRSEVTLAVRTDPLGTMPSTVQIYQSQLDRRSSDRLTDEEYAKLAPFFKPLQT